MHIAITGATGNVGVALLDRLRDDDHVDAITAIVRRPPTGPAARGVRWLARDLGAADLDVDRLVGDLQGVDAVVHLAWIIQPARDLGAMHAVNVVGSDRVFRAAAAAGVRVLVHASSIGAYSPRHDHAPVDESWPTHGTATSGYARQKAHVERALDAVEAANPTMRVVRLRPGLIFQARQAAEVSDYFLGPLLPLPLLRPRVLPLLPTTDEITLQAVHTDDVAAAYHLALHRDVRGAFNIAADPVLSMDDLAGLLGARPVPVPAGLLRAGAAATYHLRLQPTPPGWVDMARSVPVMSTARAREELGWAPQRSSRDAVSDLLDGLRSGRRGATPPLQVGAPTGAPDGGGADAEGVPGDGTAQPLHAASALDTAAVVGGVLAPLFARGLILRRPPVVAAAQAMDADARAVRVVQRLRARHGRAPLRIPVPGREVVLVLDHADAADVLARSPEPFAPGGRLKRSALDHVQPAGVLASSVADRPPRRAANEHALDFPTPVHHLAGRFAAVVAEEVEDLLAEEPDQLDFQTFATSWMRVVRRIVFGDAARDDEAITELSAHLRAAANWALLRPRSGGDLQSHLDRIQHHLDDPDPMSLVGVLAQLPDTPATALAHQVPQWLFAFDPAGMETFRALAVLASHPAERARATAEVAAADLAQPALLPHLRRCVLDTIRLWPTTPAILRETTTATVLGGRHLPAGATVLVHAPSFHRDPDVLGDAADRFTPDLWDAERGDVSSGAGAVDPALVPFSDGPGRCPGEHVVLLVASTWLANVLARREVTASEDLPLSPDAPLPGTFDQYHAQVRLRPRS